MAARCSKCQAPGREHAKFSCPPRPGAKARAKAAFRANGITESPTDESAADSEIPQRGAPIAGTGKPAASSDQTKKKKESAAA